MSVPNLYLIGFFKTEVATSPSGAWERLHRVNQDLHRKLEAQCWRQGLTTQQAQTLKRSYGEATDAVRHHEAEIHSLQAKLSSAATELAIKEQALAQLRGDLQVEQDKARERLAEWQHSEATLSCQLQASEQKLRSAEALLLVRTRELQDLETQQALQGDQQEEALRLQERVAELSQQLSTSEQAQRLMEERLQRNYALLLESCEKEKRGLLQSLRDVEVKASAYEDQLQAHERQMEVLQKEQLGAGAEGHELVRRLEEQLDMREAGIQTLAEHVQSLRDERDLLRQRFQELTVRVAVSDGDMAELQEKLRGREADYQSLELSYRTAAGQLQAVHTLLKEKEEELTHIKEIHERVLEKKDQDLNEALVKMVALGSSLEETEIKLRAKEEILRKFAKASSEELEGPRSSPEEAEENPHPRLEDEDPGADLGEECGDSSPRREVSMVPQRSEVPDREGQPQAEAKLEQGVPSTKRQRIRFSTIQCQKYSQPDTPEKTWASSTSSDTSQDRSPSEESMSSEAAPSSLPTASDSDTYLSIIHSLETKLYITEEKLRDVTVRLESQQGQSREALLALHRQWASAEGQLREQLRTSLLQVRALASQLDQERQARAQAIQSHVGELGTFQVKNSQALACLENCQEQLRCLPLAGQEDAQGEASSPLASVEQALISAMQALHHWPAPVDSGAPARVEEGCVAEEGEAVSQQLPQRPELTEQQQLKLLSEQIALEASLIDQIADSLKNTTSDVSRLLHEVSQSAQWPLEAGSVTICPGAPAETWAKKLLVDGEFWSQVESLSEHLGTTLGSEAAGAAAGRQQSVPQALVPALADATWVRAELSFAVQSVRESFQRRLQSIQDTLQGTQAALQQHKRMLGEILGAYQTPDFDSVMQQVSEALSLPTGIAGSAQAPWDSSPLEELGQQDVAGSQDPSCWSNQSSGALVALQEELALQLKEKASLLGEIAAALTSLPPMESLRGCQKLLQASQTLSYDTYLGGLSQYSSLLVKDAIIQAQVCYAACKIRLQYEKELQCYKESWQSRGAVGALRGEYEELLRKQKSEYMEVIAIMERENAELKAKVAQLDHQQRYLEEVENRHSESMCALQGRHEEEMRSVLEQLSRAENSLQAEHSRVLSQLDASVRDRQDLERQHVAQMRTLEDRFQLKVRELQTIHEEELRTLQEHYSRGVQRLQETLCQLQGPHPEALPAPSPPGSPQKPPSSWPASQPRDTVRMAERAAESMTGLRERIQELEAQMDVMREELEHRDLEGSAATLRDKYQKDFENLKVSDVVNCRAVEGQALSCLLGVVCLIIGLWGAAGTWFLALSHCVTRIKLTETSLAVAWP